MPHTCQNRRTRLFLLLGSEHVRNEENVGIRPLKELDQKLLYQRAVVAAQAKHVIAGVATHIEQAAYIHAD